MGRAISYIIPSPALGFGLAGLLPFFAGALACWISPEVISQPFKLDGATVLCTYGAIILSFLGGIRWGVAMHHQDMIQSWKVVGWAMVPSLLGWFALFVPTKLGLPLLLIGFVLQFIIDYRSTKAGVTAPWFLRLRTMLTVGATLSIGVGWLGVLVY